VKKYSIVRKSIIFLGKIDDKADRGASLSIHLISSSQLGLASGYPSPAFSQAFQPPAFLIDHTFVLAQGAFSQKNS